MRPAAALSPVRRGIGAALPRPRPRRSILADRAGSSAIDFALIGPVFLLVLFAAFDLARLVLVMATMEFAAQEGARFASLRGSSSPMQTTDEEVSSLVRSFIQGADADEVAVSVSWSPDASPGSTVAVYTDYVHQVLMGLIPIPPINLNGRASLVVM